MAKAARATISDVAKAAKTGKTSISRYLNGEKHLLSDDLLSRIEKAIAELDYRPSLMARGLKHGRTRLIGLIIADITNPYSVNVMSGIEAACREKGFTLLVCNTNNELDQELHYLDLLRSYQVEGIVVNAVGMREDGLNRLQQSALPMVLIDRKIPDFACDVVGLDNAQAATTATEHLVEKGFEAILFLSEPLGSVNTRRERLSAFRATLARHHGVVAENAEVQLNDGAMLDNVLRQFHARHRGMRKAVISANGALTLQVARALKGLKLPRDSSEQGRPEHDHIHQHMPEQHHAVRIAQTFARKPLRAKLLLPGSALLEHPGVKPGALQPGRRPSPDRDVVPIDLAQRRLNRRWLAPFFIHLGFSSFLPLRITASAQSIPSTAALMMPPA